MVDWSAAKQAGLALAALLSDDRALAHVEGALPAALVARARAQLAPTPPVDDLEASARATGHTSGTRDVARQPSKSALIAELLAEVRPPITRVQRSLPPRLAALLAPKLPRSLARELIAAAPRARPEFAPAPELLQRLFRIARWSVAHEAEP